MAINRLLLSVIFVFTPIASTAESVNIKAVESGIMWNVKKYLLLLFSILILSACAATDVRREITYGEGKEVKSTYSTKYIYSLGSQKAYHRLVLSMINQRPEITEHLLDKGITDTISKDTNISQAACASALPGMVDLVQRYRPWEKINYDICIRDVIDRFGIYLSNDMLKMSSADGEIFINIHYQENHRLPQRVSPLDWIPKTQLTATNLPRVYLKVENKEDYLISILKQILNEKPNLNTIYLGPTKDMFGQALLNRPIKFGPANLTLRMQEILMESGYDPNFQYPCYKLGDPFFDRNNHKQASKEQYERWLQEFKGECSAITQILGLEEFITFRFENPEIKISNDQADKTTAVMVKHGLDVNKLLSHSVQTGTQKGKQHHEIIDLTPLHLAAIYGSEGLYSALLSAGANPNKSDSRGLLPSDYANHYNNIVHLRKKISDEITASKNAKGSNLSWMSKSIAIGLGAVAIGSLDVSSEAASQAFGAFASDIVSDTGGQNLNALQQQIYIQASDKRPMNSYDHLNSSYSQPASSNFSDDHGAVTKSSKSHSESAQKTVSTVCISGMDCDPCQTEWNRKDQCMAQCPSKASSKEQGLDNCFNSCNKIYRICADAIRKNSNKKHSSPKSLSL